MSWCESQGISYIFGLAGTKPLSKKVENEADAIRTERAVQDLDVVRGFAETKHRAGSWTKSRRIVARIEATRLGCDHRYVVTNIKTGTTEWLYDSLYCAGGTGGKPDQTSQNPTRLGSHQLPFAMSQSSSSCSPHRSLLADARRP